MGTQAISVRSAFAPGTAAEDYLVGIAALAEADDPVTGAHLARLLGVSEPSVTQMARRLVAARLVEPRPKTGGTGMHLTPRGTAVAAWLLARRRVCECFFVDAIGLDWPTARQAANQMEHGLSDDAVRQLHQGLGAPTTCPHGNRLDLLDPGAPPEADARAAPRAAGPSEAPGDRPHATLLLDAVPAGGRVTVQRLLGPIEQDAAALDYLYKEGITPGQSVVVEGAVPASDVLAVRRGRRRCIVPARLAALIGVQVQQAAPSRAARDAQAGSRPQTLPPPCRPDGNVCLTALRVDGPCSSGHKPGESFRLGSTTPAGLCGATYAAVLPAVKRLLAGDGADPLLPVLERRCPGDGYVVWRLEPAPS